MQKGETSQRKKKYARNQITREREREREKESETERYMKGERVGGGIKKVASLVNLKKC